MKQEMLEKIKEKVLDSIDINNICEDSVIKEIIFNQIFIESKNKYISIEEKQNLADKIYNSMRGLDILQPLIDNEEINEIMVNGYKNIFIEKNGEMKKTDLQFETNKKLEDIIMQIVSKINRTVNEANPIVDARLLDGSRVSVVLPPVALNGPILTIRKFTNKTLNMEDLIKWGTLDNEAAKFLKEAVKNRYNILISGGTSSGKTTFLNILSNYIPSSERIITIEDSAELRIQKDNVVRLETKNANSNGKGEITAKELIKTALRMRPDRIIVGEVRGGEALDMLQAMNTGHDGSISTGHANSVKDMFSRLETMVIQNVEMPLESVRRQIASAVEIIIHTARYKGKCRRVMEISELEGYDGRNFIINPIYNLTEGKLAWTGNKLKKLKSLHWDKRSKNEKD